MIEASKEDLRQLIIPVIIILVVYGFIVWFMPHSDMYKENVHTPVNYYYPEVIKEIK